MPPTPPAPSGVTSTQPAQSFQSFQSFMTKWARTELTERAASQEHFIDLCRLLGQPTPAEHDPRGIDYAFEKSIAVTGPASAGTKGDRGFVDVWWRGKFAWEYKRKGTHATLVDAYRQLCQYREALENPPLLIVCDIERIEIHTNFTGSAKAIHEISIGDIGSPKSIDLLRRVFEDPASFKPTITAEKITEEVAARFGTLAESLRKRSHDPQQAAHFLMRCMFCLFAEDVGLLPRDLFKRTLEQWHEQPKRLRPILDDLFKAMAKGGSFGPEPVDWFNGGLFDDAPAIELSRDEVGILLLAAKQDWSSVEPAIFGTLFERSLDPQKRSQIGAHYTSRDDIMLVIEPVILAPLRREWAQVKATVADELARRRKATTKATKTKADKAIIDALMAFDHRLAGVRVLDPACGSGNFLYVAIQQLLDLEKEVITFAAQPEIAGNILPQVRPSQLHGIEINPYAAELAQVVIWIGYLQWMRDNGFRPPKDPILEPLKNIECRDAILDLSEPEKPKAAEWPEAEFVVGNPPFLGVRQFRSSGLTDKYVESLFAAYDLPRTSDLCCYWFELARRKLTPKLQRTVGLLATQGIRGRDSREVLERIAHQQGIACAWSDRPWMLEGAAVHVSIVVFPRFGGTTAVLDGVEVSQIHADLDAGEDLTQAKSLAEMSRLSFQGPVKVGTFELDLTTTLQMLREPRGPSGLSNVDVVRPFRNGESITSRFTGDWIIDFGLLDLERAAHYPAPLGWVELHVKPERMKARRAGRAKYWWLFGEPNPNMRTLLSGLPRFLATCQTAKHRLWTWLEAAELAGQTVIGVARSDDYFFGVLHSSVHEHWALRQGTQLEDRPRYTPTSTFETFPLPWPPGTEPKNHPIHARISAAAEKLNTMRERWLNPPELIDPIAARIDSTDDFSDVPKEARALIRHSAIMAAAAKDPKLKKRTLTNLYNERPTWLQLAHEELDRAVLAAYAEVDPTGGWSESWAEVWKETGAGWPLPDGHALAAQRAEIDQRVLANLLRMNHARASSSTEGRRPGKRAKE